MHYTNNLHLQVLDNTDTFNNTWGQGNAIATQLETVLGGLIDDIETIPQIRIDVTALEADVAAVQSSVEVVDNKVDAVDNRVDGVIADKYKGVLHTENGDINGTFYKYIKTVAATGYRSAVFNDVDATHRNAIFKTVGTIAINARTLAGITSISNLHVINALACINNYDVTNNPVTASFVFSGVYKAPGETDYYFHFGATNMDIIEQTYNTASETWQPTPSGTYQDKTVDVMIEFFIEDSE